MFFAAKCDGEVPSDFSLLLFTLLKQNVYSSPTCDTARQLILYDLYSTNVNGELSQVIHTMRWLINHFRLIRSVQNYFNAKKFVQKLCKHKITNYCMYMKIYN